MRKYSAVFIVVVLFIISVFLGYKIYKTVVTTKVATVQPIKKNQTGKPILSDEQASKQLSEVNLSQLSTLELNNIILMSEQVGKSGDTITISKSCGVAPQVLKIAKIGPIKVKNSDTKKHTLAYITAQVIGPNQTATLNVGEFKNGLNRYGCDNKPAGYILVGTPTIGR